MPKTLRDCLGLLPKTKGKYFTDAHRDNLIEQADYLSPSGKATHESSLKALHAMLAETVATHNGLFPVTQPKPDVVDRGLTPVQPVAVQARPIADAPNHIEDLLEKVKEQRAATAPNAEAGRGKKAARLFEEMDGKNSGDDIAELYKDSKADRKVAVMLSPDGGQIVVGSVKKQQKRGMG